MQRAQPYQAIPDEEYNAIEGEFLKRVENLTGEELERYIHEHDIFMKNIDIASKSEASFSALVPQFIILLERMRELKHTIVSKKAFYIVCSYVSADDYRFLNWKGYAALVNHLQRCDFDADYVESLTATYDEPIFPSYSLDEFRRRIYELKGECVHVSSARYSDVKLRLWAKNEWRDIFKMYAPFIFSTISLVLSLYNFIYKK